MSSEEEEEEEEERPTAEKDAGRPDLSARSDIAYAVHDCPDCGRSVACVVINGTTFMHMHECALPPAGEGQADA